MAGTDAGGFPIQNSQLTIDIDSGDAQIGLQGRRIISLIQNGIGVEQHQICVSTGGNDALSAQAVPLCRIAGHFPHGFLQRQELLLPDVAAQNPRECADCPGMGHIAHLRRISGVCSKHAQGVLNQLRHIVRRHGEADIIDGKMIVGQELAVSGKGGKSPELGALENAFSHGFRRFGGRDDQNAIVAALQQVVVPFLRGVEDLLLQFSLRGGVPKPLQQAIRAIAHPGGRQCRTEYRGAGRIGVHIVGGISLLPDQGGAVCGAAPIVPAHGLVVGDVGGKAGIPGHLQGFAHAVQQQVTLVADM